jgi:hypothetical protein
VHRAAMRLEVVCCDRGTGTGRLRQSLSRLEQPYPRHGARAGGRSLPASSFFASITRLGWFFPVPPGARPAALVQYRAPGRFQIAGL